MQKEPTRQEQVAAMLTVMDVPLVDLNKNKPSIGLYAPYGQDRRPYLLASEYITSRDATEVLCRTGLPFGPNPQRVLLMEIQGLNGEYHALVPVGRDAVTIGRLQAIKLITERLSTRKLGQLMKELADLPS